jgi:LPS O-antigen subunit length determinant protein (WzzB/FepE family)
VSDTRKEEQVQYVPVQMMPMGGDEDEIDLLDLWRILVKGKWIIAGVTLCCVLAGVGYALLATPVYEIEALLAPGTIDFNDNQQPIKNVSTGEMAEWFKSSAYLPEIVKKYGMEAVKNGTISYEGLAVRFDKNAQLLTLSLKSNIPENSRAILNDIITIYAEQEKTYPAAKAHMEKRIFDLTQQLDEWDFKRSRLDDDIVRTIGKRKILDTTLSTLDTHIAEQKNIMQRMEKQVDMINANTQDLLVLRKEMFEAKADKLSELMYANFTQQNIAYSANLESRMDALRADINNQSVKREKLLNEMKDMELLIKDKKEKQTKELTMKKQSLEKLLALVRVQLTKLSPVEIIQPPFISIKPVAPKKRLIVALSCVGGVFLGIFAVFFVNFLKKARQEDQDAAA